ncbi:UNVERIFIED_ORG: hypothetical protein ABIC97_000580 [Peribacillus simplex]
MRRPGQDEKTLKRAIKLNNERETNGMSVNDIVKATGVPRYLQKLNKIGLVNGLIIWFITSIRNRKFLN